MPTLFRFLLVLCLIGVAAYAAIYALARFVDPSPREITVTVPPERMFKDR